MTALYYVHNQMLGLNSIQLTHGVTLRICILGMPCSNPGRDTDCREDFTGISFPKISKRAWN